MSNLQKDQVTQLKEALIKRRAYVLEDIRTALLRSDNEHYGDLAGKVHDIGEESVADLLTDRDIAIIDFQVKEISAIELALSRISMGSYGECDECGVAIEFARLQSYPTAIRCVTCQDSYDKKPTPPARPSL